MKKIKRKKTKLLKKKNRNHINIAKIFHICKEKFENKYLKNEKYRKVRDHFYYTEENGGAADTIYNLKHGLPKSFL